MHKVCNLRDLDLRTRESAKDIWSAYTRDLNALMDSVIDGGLASIHSANADHHKNAA